MAAKTTKTTRKKAPGQGKPEPKGAGKTRPVSVWLDPDHEAWLKNQPKGISVVVRSLVTEAMNLEMLARSVKKRRK